VPDHHHEIALAPDLHFEDAKAVLGIVEGDALDCPGERLKRLLLHRGETVGPSGSSCLPRISAPTGGGERPPCSYAERRIAGMYVPILFYPWRQPAAEHQE
jgi:hypothetical protein